MQRTFTVITLFFGMCANSYALEVKSESAIRIAPYNELYAKQGISDALPKVLLFSSKGECVGVTTADATNAKDLTAFIEKSFKANKKECNMVMSEKFGVTAVGDESGVGSKVVQLVILGESFCTACADYKKTLVDYVRSDLSLMVIKIDSSKK